MSPSRARPIPLSKRRILDFDLETVAAGYADPAWVPSKIMCVAWSWVGDDAVHVEVCGKRGYFDPEPRRDMLQRFLPVFNAADIVTAHNAIRFDLPTLNSELIRLDLPPLTAKLVIDTMRLPKARGLKKGQDVLSDLFSTAARKLPLNWQQWEDAYEQDGWETVKSRCAGDVGQHKQLFVELGKRGLLARPVAWRP